MFGRFLGWYTIYTFSGDLAPLTEFCHVQYSLYDQLSLAFSYIGSVTARHSSSGRQPNCRVVQGMELRNFRRGRQLCLAELLGQWPTFKFLSFFPAQLFRRLWATFAKLSHTTRCVLKYSISYMGVHTCPIKHLRGEKSHFRRFPDPKTFEPCHSLMRENREI